MKIVRSWPFPALAAVACLSMTPTLPAADSAGNELPAASLDDLFSEDGATAAAVSPSGRYIATVVRKGDIDRVAITNLETGTHEVVTQIGRKDLGQRFDTRMTALYWKTDERLLFRMDVLPADGVKLRHMRFGGFRRMGSRLFAVDRNGKNLVQMLGDNNNFALDFAFGLGEIHSMLPLDPGNILMIVDGRLGRSLFKVDVGTGAGTVVEHPSESAWNWWLDAEGRAIVRVEVSLGEMRFYRREADDKWKNFYRVRLREFDEQRTDFDLLGVSEDPDKVFVLARPPGAQRYGVYLYDLPRESFGQPVIEHPQFDIYEATISDDGRKVVNWCYLAHVYVCESANAKVNAHLKGLRKFFHESANIYLVDSSHDEQTLLLNVEGPGDAPAYYEYRLAQKQINFIGYENQSLAERRMPTSTLVEYAARDGMKVHGYLTRPPGAEVATNLPLVVMPHGGPEWRDHLSYDVQMQHLAAAGYAVFQPNFRGSLGFGLDYVESGHGEWGRKMQDDITDGVQALVDGKVADPKRICIVGASYGGYAALAGAALTPKLYQCAVSIAGISDLDAFLRSRRNRFGAKSTPYEYWVRQIGDPDRESERIAAASPSRNIDRIEIPILLIHGEDDDIVPFSQSTDLKQLLDKSGRRTELIAFEDEGHSGWKTQNARRSLDAVRKFVSGRIGPGYASQSEKRHDERKN